MTKGSVPKVERRQEHNVACTHLWERVWDVTSLDDREKGMASDDDDDDDDDEEEEEAEAEEETDTGVADMLRPSSWCRREPLSMLWVK